MWNFIKSLMNILSLKKISNFIAVMVMVAVLVSILGALYFMGMGMELNGKMSNCIFMSINTGICNMTLAEHINLWQVMFTAIIQKGFLLNALLVILLYFVYVIVSYGRFNQVLFLKEFVNQFYLKLKAYLSFFDYLKEALSFGVLSPKIYRLVTI